MVTNPRRSLKNKALRFTKAASKDAPIKSNNSTTYHQCTKGKQRGIKMLLLETKEIDMRVRGNPTKQLPRRLI